MTFLIADDVDFPSTAISEQLRRLSSSGAQAHLALSRSNVSYHPDLAIVTNPSSWLLMFLARDVLLQLLLPVQLLMPPTRTLPSPWTTRANGNLFIFITHKALIQRICLIAQSFTSSLASSTHREFI